MEVEGVEWFKGEPLVYVSPSAESGIFLSRHDQPSAVFVGKYAIIHGVVESKARALEKGETVLGQCGVEADEEELGKFILTDGVSATIRDVERLGQMGSSFNCGSEIYEFDPHTSD